MRKKGSKKRMCMYISSSNILEFVRECVFHYGGEICDIIILNTIFCEIICDFFDFCMNINFGKWRRTRVYDLSNLVKDKERKKETH
jgi:hypothetical protein